MLAQLRAVEGDYLVVVRYRPGHDPLHEWVYNEADLDHAKVVWAREMNAGHDAALLHYFKDRHTWLLDADAQPPQLVPYPAAIPHTEPRR